LKEIKNILFYDGDCALCNRCVRYVTTHEKNNELFFSSLQSDYAKQLLAKYNYNFSNLSTLVLVLDGKIFYKSDAALNLSKFLKPPYSWALALKIFPRFLRNAVYDIIARNRKKWWKKEFCFLPTLEMKKRFISH
jgi:predicted DCC family thiol-disulfide oxidoreductase YuxK